MSGIRDVVEEVRAELAPDPRMSVFEIRVESLPDGHVLHGETTMAAAVERLVARLEATAGRPRVLDQVRRLPDAVSGYPLNGLVRAAAAPVNAAPEVASGMVSQLVLGHRVELLSRRGAWYRVRSEDGYIGWMHHGYLAESAPEWALAWEHGSQGEPVVSLGAELIDEEERVIARLPWGARAMAEAPGRFLLPDGRRGELGSGEVVAVDRLSDRFPPRAESVTRTARRWFGAPYLWGGVTPAGTDCSGFVQAVFWVHGIALPRDSDLQARTGVPVEMEPGDFGALRAGDLAFFAEKLDVVTHVGLALGGGLMIHSSLANGGVRINDLLGDDPVEHQLRRIFVRARRFLAD